MVLVVFSLMIWQMLDVALQYATEIFNLSNTLVYLPKFGFLSKQTHNLVFLVYKVKAH